MTDEDLRNFIASRIGDPTFRRWLDEVVPPQPSERSRETGPLTIALNYAATDQDLKKLREMARFVAEATGQEITVELTAKGEKAAVDAKLDALFERML